MSTQVQYRRGSNVQVAAFTGALGELVIDTTNKLVVVQDGATVGGFPQVGLTATQTLTNKIYQGTSLSVSGNVTGAYLFGNASTVTGLSASKIFNGTTEANIGTSGGNANITVGGTSNVLVVASTGIYTTGLSSVTGNITGGNISATNYTGTTVSVTGTVTGASVVGGVITGTSLSLSGNTTPGNVLTGGLISATGNITGGNISATNHTGTNVSVTGSITAGGDLSLIGNIVDTGALTIITSSNGNITLSPNGTGNINTGANIMPTANATANIGSATNYFNTVFAKATSAQYADLAEMYCADEAYIPGTVVEFGGFDEVTITTQSHSTQVAGIVSTNPSYLMNSTLTCTNAVEVALVGRVPCLVVGTIRKGDRLVSSDRPGVAQALNINLYQPGCIIGKALEEYNSTKPGVIEVAVGRT